MKIHDVKSLLKALNIHGTSDRQHWVNCSCPFAKWRHKGGHDNNPSFGISIAPNGTSVFKCWSCGLVGDIAMLLMKIQYYEKNTPHNQPYNWKKAWEILDVEADATSVYDFEECDYEEESPSGLKEFPETWLHGFITGTHHPYFKERKIPVDVTTLFDIRYDISENRVCVPIRDSKGILYGMQGRSVGPNPILPYKFYLYHGISNPVMWMGEYQVDPNIPVVLVEGMFDMFSVARIYPNVIASMTSSLGDAKMKRLKEYSQMIGFYDWGTGGDFARKKLGTFFYKDKRFLGNCFPEEKEGDPGEMSVVRIREELLKVAPGLCLKTEGL